MTLLIDAPAAERIASAPATGGTPGVRRSTTSRYCGGLVEDAAYAGGSDPDPRAAASRRQGWPGMAALLSTARRLF